MKTQDFAFIFGGGGARGAYQVGAWRALDEEGVKARAVAGASVGALNAALYSQNDYNLAEQIWNEIHLDQIIHLPDPIRDRVVGGKQASLFDDNLLKSVRQLGKDFFTNGGFDTTPLYELVKKSLDEPKIRKSGIDYGLIATNLSEMSGEEIFLENIPEGYLFEYILSSANFPLFKRKLIRGEKFIDGGLSENIPMEMMVRRGYRKFVILDVSGWGRNRLPSFAGLSVIYIKNSEDLGGMLEFTPERARRNSLLGYLDAKKAMGVIHGVKYFYECDHAFEKIFENTLFGEKLKMEMERLESITEEEEVEHLSGALRHRMVRTLFPKNYQHHRCLTGAMLEITADHIGIETKKIYPLREFAFAIYQKSLYIYEENQLTAGYLEGHRPGILRNMLSLVFRRRKNIFSGLFTGDIVKYEEIMTTFLQLSVSENQYLHYLRMMKRINPNMIVFRMVIQILHHISF